MTDFGSSLTTVRMMLPLIMLVSLLRVTWGEEAEEADWESSRLGPDPGEDGPTSAEIYKRLYNFGLGKRAYSYVSEYKRLPVYNFGLGKRSPRHYNFGLGKRADQYDEMLDDSYQTADLVKRIRPYNFGLGKRSPRQYNFGLGKRNKMYSFGLGKRAGLGSDDYDQLDLDAYPYPPLPARPERSLHYNFGLGKRDPAPAKPQGPPASKESAQ
ncbi:unnamed protein product [Bemisia tabaci]|uniref:Uncharacterized protein n=2 Tax=Bemisia tabaci TaxID=7038 RepID=A0A9P0F437_BEMTA|nr:unnamed protein product [Bemisia tabaci]